MSARSTGWRGGSARPAPSASATRAAVASRSVRKTATPARRAANATEVPIRPVPITRRVRTIEHLQLAVNSRRSQRAPAAGLRRRPAPARLGLDERDQAADAFVDVLG